MTHTMLSVGAHGGDGTRVARVLGMEPAALLDLSVSLNPVASDPAPIVARALHTLARYPDPEPATGALAAAMGVDLDRLLLTNGGAEAIALVAAHVRVGWAEPDEFALYRRYLPRLDAAAPRWRSNPHNPTGRLAGPHESAGVWDEAFYPLATGMWTRGDATLVVGSLTKLLACPGLRLGYVLAPDPDVIMALRHRQPEWSVNGLAAAALPELLATVDLPGWAARIAALRAALVALLEAHGLVVVPSDANYVLCRTDDGFRTRLAHAGVLVRDCTSFGLRDHVRVAVPDDEGRERLAVALAQVPRESR